MALRILYNHMQAIICFEQVIACIVFFPARHELRAASEMSAMQLVHKHASVCSWDAWA